MKVHTWPESQACLGCLNACFLANTSRYGSSAYGCTKDFSPDYLPNAENECSQYIEADEKEWEQIINEAIWG